MLERVAAGIIVALGVLYLVAAVMPRFGREWHPERLMSRAGRGGPVVAGAAFAIAWTPCVGPTLGAILTAAGFSGSEGRGALLLAFYSAGLAIPFLVTALAFDRMTTVFAAVKRHYAIVVVLRWRGPDRDGRADLDEPAECAELRGAVRALLAGDQLLQHLSRRRRARGLNSLR